MREGHIVEWFKACTKCHLEYMLVYSSGYKECTYCGYKEIATLVDENATKEAI